jgi:N4-gp56 family major capsid protein
MANFTEAATGTVALDAHLITAYQSMFLIEQENLAVGLDSLCTVKFEPFAKTISFPKYSGLAVATTPLTELEDVTSVACVDAPITVTPVEQGNPVTRTLLVNVQSGGIPDMAIPRLIGKNMRESLETLMIKVGEAGSNEITVNATNEATTAAGDVLTALHVKRARNKLARVGAQKPWSCIIHPDVLHDLLAETGAQGWTEVSARAGQENYRVFTSTVPAFAGFTFYETPLVTVNTDVGAGAVDTYHTQFFGYNAFGKAVSVEPHLTYTGPYDKLGRFINFGWYGIFKYGLVDTDYHWIITSSSSVGSNA